MARNDAVWSSLKEVREGGVAFSGRTITPLALGTLVVALATGNDKIQEGLFGCLKGQMVAPADFDFTAPVLDEPLDAAEGILHR